MIKYHDQGLFGTYDHCYDHCRREHGSKQAAESSTLEPQTGSRGVGPSAVLPSAKPCLLILPQQPLIGDQVFKYLRLWGTSHSNHQIFASQIVRNAINFFQSLRNQSSFKTPWKERQGFLEPCGQLMSRLTKWLG